MLSTFADLFCGIGGFHYAAQDLGLKCVFACRAQYTHNLGTKVAADITQIPADDVPDHDILFAGFPCQPFSNRGSHRGMLDKKGQEFYEILRIAAVKRPGFVLLENVRGFASMGDGNVGRRVEGDWVSCGASDFECSVVWLTSNPSADIYSRIS